MPAADPKTVEPWTRAVREFPGLVHLAPPVVHPDATIGDVIDAFSRDRGAGTIFVVDEADTLLGGVPESSIDADLATLVLPQQLWPHLREMDTRAILRAARGKDRRARELMVRVRSVTPQHTVIDAVGLMLRGEHPTLALVDSAGRLLGYLRLFEVLAHFLRQA